MPIGSTRSGAGGTETAIEQQPEQGTVTDANMSDELSQKLSLMNTQICTFKPKCMILIRLSPLPLIL